MVEITDDMICAAADSLRTHLGPEWKNAAPIALAALRAALNPPPREPEIEVTEEMKSLGGRYINSLVQFHSDCDFGRNKAVDVYRAMRRLEPKRDDPGYQALPPTYRPTAKEEAVTVTAEMKQIAQFIMPMFSAPTWDHIRRTYCAMRVREPKPQPRETKMTHQGRFKTHRRTEDADGAWSLHRRKDDQK